MDTGLWHALLRVGESGRRDDFTAPGAHRARGLGEGGSGGEDVVDQQETPPVEPPFRPQRPGAVARPLVDGEPLLLRRAGARTASAIARASGTARARATSVLPFSFRAMIARRTGPA
jgi:hypothetical protein